MQIKICIEDSENAIFLTLEEAHQLVGQLGIALNRNMTFPVKTNAEVNGSLTEESPETLRDPGSPHNIYNCYRYDCTPCKTLMGPKGTF